jgi:hypothetical protein
MSKLHPRVWPTIFLATFAVAAVVPSSPSEETAIRNIVSEEVAASNAGDAPLT